jgi:hypothetical protein
MSFQIFCSTTFRVVRRKRELTLVCWSIIVLGSTAFALLVALSIDSPAEQILRLADSFIAFDLLYLLILEREIVYSELR